MDVVNVKGRDHMIRAMYVNMCNTSAGHLVDFVSVNYQKVLTLTVKAMVMINAR